jgi:hypothetical protein
VGRNADLCAGCLRCDDACREKLGLAAVPVSRAETLTLDQTKVRSVPAAEGVYELYDDTGTVVKIKGVPNLRRALGEELAAGNGARFSYVEDPLYTSRESRLLQRHLAQRGCLPDEDELF